MLKKITKPDQIEVVGDHHIVQVRTAIIIEDNGVEISRSFHRHQVKPGQDYSQEHELVKSVCAAVHTPEVIEAYENAAGI